MGRFTLEQNCEILKTYFQSGDSSTETERNLRKKFVKKEVPSSQFVDDVDECKVENYYFKIHRILYRILCKIPCKILYEILHRIFQ